ncbi:MAG: methionine--tRNA ligase [Sphingobacteriia bacterium]|nr:methionine--tRNA ligase [Sphingobacteriia bacterium]
MKQPKRYLITAALPYANGLKHIGHLAGAYLPADIYVRYLRAQKRDVVFVCGSDEHGTAIPIQATKEGTTAQAIIDKYHPIIAQNFNDLGISFDIYHRTSAPLHHETAREFFQTLNNKGDLITKESEQYYDEQAGSFLADRYIKGTCPNCSYPGAYGDQCENCGKSLSPDELINPVSTLSGNPPVKKITKHWYLPLDRHEAFLRKWILEEHAEDWRPTVVGQCKSWIDGGLLPRAVTRDLDWGVTLPDDVDGGKGKVLYVWFDAPIGYISATKQWALDNGKDWKPYWENKDTKLVHFIGKDNIVFHCIIFPVMLQLHGNILPENVPANEFMNLEGDKMSTSRNWKLEMEDYINDFVKPENGGSQMADVLRYYLTLIAPESKDSEFTWKGFQDANNSELVSIFGNFVNRALVLMHKLCKGKVPPLHTAAMNELDQEAIDNIKATKEKVEKLLEEYKFRDALFEVINLARIGNQYMQKKEPWIIAKTLDTNPEGQQLIDNCLHICLQLTANLAILINPFLPFTAGKICYLLKVVEKILDWENAGSMKLLSVGYTLRAPELLFRKIEDEEIARQVEKLKAAAIHKEPVAAPAAPVATPEAIAVKPEIVFDDFAKIDLKVGTIVAAEKVEKADKLLKLQVDLGFETRTIVSGIALHFKPEEIVGKQVTVVVNLAPRKMRGIESNGMILMAEDAAGKLHFIHPETAINNGSGVS